MISKNDILISMKSKKGENWMNMQKVEDIRDTAIKLNKIKNYCPNDYFYLMGWIHCLLQKEGIADMVSRNSPIH